MDMEMKDEKTIEILLDATKYFESELKSYSYWEGYFSLMKKINPDFGEDKIAHNTPTSPLMTFFEGLRVKEWEKQVKTKSEKEELFIKSQTLSIQAYPFTHWYKTKIYYRLNQTIERILSIQGDRAYSERKKSKWSMNIPAFVFNNLPYNSFFVKTSSDAFGINDEKLIMTFGFFVTYEKDLYSEGHYLSFHVLQGSINDGKGDLISVPIYLYLPADDTTSIGDCLDRAIEAWQFSDEKQKEQMYETSLSAARRAIQYVLYLCCEKADIELIKKGSLNSTTRIRHRYGEVTQYTVGDQLSEKLVPGESGSKDYFLRTGFWKGVRHGRRGTKEERIVLTWIAPTTVTNWEHSSTGRFCPYSEMDQQIRADEEKEDLFLIHDLQDSIIDDELIDTEDPIKYEREESSTASRSRYKRSRSIAMEAIKKADFHCEICKDHITFIRKINGLPYTEPHHLIPLAYQDNFEYRLDRVANIVSLCSNCHNQIHYGIDSEELLEQLYEQRRDRLRNIGLNISLNDLFDMYR